MPGSEKYKLIRTGNVRTGTGRSMGRSARYQANAPVVMPDIGEYGNTPFLLTDLQALAGRLQEPGWTRGTRNIYGLEGLLTALLVLPLGLRPGTWLPLIWNDGDWKDPVALAGPDGARGFLDLTIGFMRALDAGFCENPPRFVSVVDTLAARYGVKAVHAQKAWAHGFGLAVSEGLNLDTSFDPTTQRSLVAIAMLLNPSSGRVASGQRSRITLQQAVLTLAQSRLSRGPLGPLT